MPQVSTGHDQRLAQRQFLGAAIGLTPRPAQQFADQALQIIELLRVQP